MANNIISAKKKALIARREQLFQEIQYYNKRIADFHAEKPSSSFHEDNSSDSDTEFSIPYNDPSGTPLGLQQARLKTSLQATEELTNLHIVQSEVNIMVQDPIIVDEPQVVKEGIWREVQAECRLGLISFTITFHVHNPSAKFGAPSYRNLRVSLCKRAYEAELGKSVLARVRTPGEAVEIIRSYSVSHRSRRSSLARLAEKYDSLLFMEPMSEGGYMLKCSDLLVIRWSLQNKWSPIAPFHHRMRFYSECMDESYIKTIRQYNRELSDPSVETDERTALLCKIINTCLEAKGLTQELYESMESDPETAQSLRKRWTTLDQEVPKRKRDIDIMAPPKSLPKKGKARGKENIDIDGSGKVGDDVNKKSVRNSAASHKNVTTESSKAKNGSNNNFETVSRKENKSNKDTGGEIGSITKIVNNIENRKVTNSLKVPVTEVTDAGKDIRGNARSKDNVGSAKTKADKGKDTATIANEQTAPESSKNNQISDYGGSNMKEVNVRDTNVVDRASNVAKVTKTSANDKNNEDVIKNPRKVINKRVAPKNDANKDNTEKNQKVKVTQNNSDKNSKESTKTKVNSNENTDTNNANDKTVKVPKKNKKTDDIDEVPAKKSKIDKATIIKQQSNAKVMEIPKKSINNANKPQKIVKNVPKNSNTQTVAKTNANKQNNMRKTDSASTKNGETIQKVTEKNKIVANTGHLADCTDVSNKNNAINQDKTKNDKQNKIKIVQSNIENNKNVNNEKMNVVTGNTQLNIVKKMGAGNKVKDISTDSKVSKIPKKLTKVPDSSNKNPHRISPRKLSSNLHNLQGITNSLQKPATGIPRLLKKPLEK